MPLRYSAAASKLDALMLGDLPAAAHAAAAAAGIGSGRRREKGGADQEKRGKRASMSLQ